MIDLSIRTADATDVAALARLIAGFRDHLEAGAPADSDIRERLPRVLREPGIEFSCAWLGDEAVGYTQTRFFSSVWESGLEAYLEDLFVVPTARCRCVGRSLLRHALGRAAARGASRFSLSTNDRNEAAHSLYRAEGLSPRSYALYPGGREVLWSRSLGAP